MAKQPKVNPPVTQREKLFDKLTIATLLAMLVVAAIYYPQLPQEIPIHFNGKGEPDGFGNKMTLWLVPLIGLGVSLPMFYLYKIPHTYNYMTKITPENAAYEYQRAREMLRMTNFSMALVFFVVTTMICYSAMNGNAGSGPWLIIVILILAFAPMIWYFASAKPKTK